MKLQYNNRRGDMMADSALRDKAKQFAKDMVLLFKDNDSSLNFSYFGIE